MRRSGTLYFSGTRCARRPCRTRSRNTFGVDAHEAVHVGVDHAAQNFEPARAFAHAAALAVVQMARAAAHAAAHIGFGSGSEREVMSAEASLADLRQTSACRSIRACLSGRRR